MGLYDTRIDDELIESVRARIASNVDTVAFTGGRIFGADWEELDGPVIPPCIYLSPKRADGKRLPSYAIEMDYVVRFRLYLPRATPATDAVASPGVPSVTKSAGPLNVSRYYGVTAFNSRGESWLTRAALPSDANPIARTVLVNQRAALAWSSVANADGYRVWATEDEGLAFRWLATTDETSFVDDVPDADLGHELAPIKFFATIVKGYLHVDLLSGEPYRNRTGRQLADPATETTEIEDRPLPGRNLRLLAFDAHIPTRITTARQPAVSVPG